MKNIENYLKEHWYLTKEIRQLMMDLSLAKHAYEESCTNMPSTCNYETVILRSKNIARPVEIKVMIMIDQYGAEVDSIDKRLKLARARIRGIEKIVASSNLTTRENEYVRLRYFSNLQAQAVAQRLFCSEATCGRIRRYALKKIEKVAGLLQ